MEVADILTANDNELEFLAAPKPISDRGDTLNSTSCPSQLNIRPHGARAESCIAGLLTVRITSPANDILKVE